MYNNTSASESDLREVGMKDNNKLIEEDTNTLRLFESDSPLNQSTVWERDKNTDIFIQKIQLRGSDTHNPESIQSPSEINNITLPPIMKSLVTEYNTIIGIRDEFVWKWIYSLFPAFTLNTVTSDQYNRAITQKMMLTMYVTITDDIAETSDDYATFQEARKIANPNATAQLRDTKVDTQTLRFLQRLWNTFCEKLKNAPKYDEYSEHFQFDIQQTLNSIHYSHFVSHNPGISNLNESWAYGPHNMVMYAYSDIDLMYSDTTPDSDIRQLRSFLYTVQKMARIGNWVSTWEREIGESDYSAGIIVKALEDEIVTVNELNSLPQEELVERINAEHLESYFLLEWNKFYDNARNTDYNTTHIDLQQLLTGMETVLTYHLDSRGHK